MPDLAQNRHVTQRGVRLGTRRNARHRAQQMIWLVAAVAVTTAAQACSEDPGEGPDASPTELSKASDTAVSGDLLPAPTGTSATLSSGDATLVVDLQTRRLVLSYAGEARTTVELDSLQFGRVPDFDPGWAYNPVYIDDSPPDGLQWLAVGAVSFADHLVPAPFVLPEREPAAPSDGVTIDLITKTDTGDAGPGMRLTIDAIDHETFRCELIIADSDLRAQTAKDVAKNPIVYSRVATGAGADERFWGLGEYLDGPEHRGRRRAMQIEPDFGQESAYNEAHVPIPLVIGSAGWGLFVESRRPALFDVAKSDPERVVATFATASLPFWLMAAAHPAQVTGQYTRITGAPAVPARWAFGGLIWRNENESQAEVLDDMAQIRAHDLALSGMWIDRPYDTHVNNFDFDPARFPDADAMIAAIHAQGLRVALWSTPYLEDGADRHDEAVAQGLFVGVPKLAANFMKWGPPIDFTNPAARSLWDELVQKVTKRGIEGFKLDFAEDVHVGLFTVREAYVFDDGSDERTMHHGYAPLYHEAYSKHLPADGGFLICRAGTYGDQRLSTVIWPGDLCANLTAHGECVDEGGEEVCHVGGLPASVSAMLSLAPSGYPLYGADTGGYRHGRPTKQTFLRWLAQTALSPILQIGGGKHSNPWDFEIYGDSQFDQEVLDAAVVLTRLHLRLFPYIYGDALAAHEHRLGPVRPLGLAHPELIGAVGTATFDALATNSYLLGDMLLVAPIVDSASSREVLLPPGRWFDWWSHAPATEAPGHNGDEAKAQVLTVAAPLGRIPFFVTAGALIPMLRPDLDTLAPATEPGVESFADAPGRLHVVVVPGDAGDRGVYDGSELTLRAEGNGWRVSAQPGVEYVAGVELEVWMAAKPAAVTVDGDAAAAKADAAAAADCERCWWWDDATSVAHVRLATAGGTAIVTP